MTVNSHRYAVKVIINDVGWLSDNEARDIAAVIDECQGRFDLILHQLHLYWNVLADSMSEATRQADVTLRRAQDATGVCTPRATVFEVREIDAARLRLIPQQKD